MSIRSAFEAALRGLTTVGIVALSLGGLAWSQAAMPGSMPAISLSQAARYILLDETYPTAYLAALAAGVDEMAATASCHSEQLQSLLVVRLKLAETTLFGADYSLFQPRMNAIAKTSSALLECVPQNSLAWLSLYWSTIHAEGISDRVLGYLANSYRAGPREAWIAIRRNPLAVSVIHRLEPHVQEAVLREWTELVQGALFDSAALALRRADLNTRERLLDRGKDAVKPVNWRLFARRLDRLDIDIALPNIEENRLRPWR